MRNITGALIMATTSGLGAGPSGRRFPAPLHLRVEGRYPSADGPEPQGRHGCAGPPRQSIRSGVPGIRGDRPRHRVWITDSGTASVHIFDHATGAYQEIRRVGDAPLKQPSGLAVDGQGRIFLTDAGTGGVFMFDEKGEFDHSLSKHARSLEAPTAIALSENGKTIYVADPPRNVVVELNREGEVDGTIALPPELGEPSAISVIDNQVYVLGNRQHRVGVFTPGGRQRGEFQWDGVQFPRRSPTMPARKQFLVANPRWAVVQIFTAEGQNIATFGQLGERVDQMQRVDALHVDPQGLLYLVDSHHGKVLVFGDSPHGL